MSNFWTDPWAGVEATRRIEIATEQNHRYLEIAGEPCYLFKRRQRGLPVATIPGSAEIEPDPELIGFYRVVLWDTTQETDRYPELSTVSLSVDGIQWSMAFDKNHFTEGAQEFAVDEWKDRVDVNNVEISNAVYAVLNTPPFTPGSIVTVNFTTIAERVAQVAMQPITVDDPKTARSLYGYDQFLNPNISVRGRMWPHTFLLGFPNVPRDLNLVPAGLELTAPLRHWTQAPPFSPEIDEHDVIVRTTNQRRYEIINMERITHAGQIVQQQFDIVEFNPDAPEYELVVLSV